MQHKTVNTPVVKDWYMLGAIAGLGSTLAREILNRSLDKLGIKMINYDSVASGLLLGKKAKLFGAIPNYPVNKGEYAIGFLSNMVYGTLFGIATSYLYTKTPPGNEMAKGAIGGAGWWAINLTLGHQLKLDGLTKVKPPELAKSFVTHILYGAAQGWIFGKYGTKLIDQSHPVMVTNTTMQEFDHGRLDQQPPASTNEVRLH